MKMTVNILDIQNAASETTSGFVGNRHRNIIDKRDLSFKELINHQVESFMEPNEGCGEFYF